MEDGTLNFPLFNLPNGPLKCVLQNMVLVDQIEFSILSKRSKELVKSLNLQDYEIVFGIDRFFFVEIIDQKNPQRHNWMIDMPYRMDDNKIVQKKIYTPDFLRTIKLEERQLKIYAWKKPGFEVKDWINHFLSIFNRHKVHKIYFKGRTSFDIEDIHKAIGGVNEIQINDRYPVPYIQQVVQTFASAKQFILVFENLRFLKNLHNILCQNFDDLRLLSTFPDSLPECELNDLMIMNSRTIVVCYSTLTEKDLNRFLKHWIHGSNSRMEHMLVRFPTDKNGNKEVILNGLSHQVVPPNQEKLFKSLFEDNDGVIKDGYDIRRIDGTTATIILREDDLHQHFTMEFVVWQ